MPTPIFFKGMAGVLAGSLWLTTVLPALPAEPSSAPKSTSETTPLNAEAAHQRIAALRTEIARHDALYFKHATPEISDTAYDALKRELLSLEQRFPTTSTALTPSPALADDHNDGFTKAAHRVPMLSLAKAYTETELRAFYKRVATTDGQGSNFIIEPKVDGLAVSAIYEHGRFVRAITRGNGHEGDDITANALALRSLPHELRAIGPGDSHNPTPDYIELRGEIYLSRAEFAYLNRERAANGEAPLAHPRNVAVGTIKSHDPQETADRRLDIVFYGWGACEPAALLPATQQAFLKQAKAWGLPIVESYQVVNSANQIWAAAQALGQRRDKLNAPTDGAVIKLNDVARRSALGESAQEPRWAIAYKYPATRVTTQLRNITLQVGRTGQLTPVAELAPIAIGGSTIARASLHNRDIITRLDLRPGDFVFVEKAGEVIPEIVGVDLTRRPAQSPAYTFPEKCPACGAAIIAATEAATLCCPNTQNCPAQLRARLTHFASKTGVAIAGLGEATITELIASGHVRQPADLYALTLEAMKPLPGLGEKSAQQLLIAIERSRRAELWRFINGLSIPRVGPTSAKLLANHFGSLEKLAAAQPADFPARFSIATRQSTLAFFASSENRALVTALAKAVQPTTPMDKPSH